MTQGIYRKLEKKKKKLSCIFDGRRNTSTILEGKGRDDDKWGEGIKKKGEYII